MPPTAHQGPLHPADRSGPHEKEAYDATPEHRILRRLPARRLTVGDALMGDPTSGCFQGIAPRDPSTHM